MLDLFRLLLLYYSTTFAAGRLDVTFFIQKVTPSSSGSFFIAGFSGGDSISIVGTSFSFGRILNTGTGSGLPVGSYERDFKDYSRRLHLPEGSDRPGVYYCDADATSGVNERLQTVLVAEEAEIKPKSPTKTLGRGDDVTLTMTTSISETLLKWRHNGIQKSEWNGQTSITISFAKPSDAGIYECYSSETQRSQGKHGFMRLIVRGCPSGKWDLPECLQSCSTCYNGGICNSDTGECICPPGFMGTNCETGCGKNRWGMTCDRRCSSSNPDGCRRSMLCLADPYGCSCSASYGGPDCATDCADGNYGSGCTESCHCVNGCNKETGVCYSGGCIFGWSGQVCQIPDGCPDGFYGELCTYKCHCKNNAACDKISGVCSNEECAPGWVNVNITDCQQDGSPKIWSLYNLKVNPGEQTSIICRASRNPVLSPDDVALIDQSGSAVTRTSHSFTGTYLSISNYSGVTVDNGLQYICRVDGQSTELTTFNLYVQPKFSQSNHPEITPQATQATVRWEQWQEGKDLGDGPVEAYKVYYKKTTDTDWTAHQHFPVVDSDQMNYSTEISGLDWSTKYNFTVTVKRPGPKGEGSKETYSTITTLCDVPTQGPLVIRAISSHPDEVQITFTVPGPSIIRCDSDGYIKDFHIKYRKANTRDEYDEIIVNDVGARTFVIDRLLAFTEYELMVSFNNRNEQSPWSSAYKARTAEDVPSKPRNVKLKPAVYTIEVHWSIPVPSNGIINKYVIIYWETDNESNSRIQKEVTENLKDVNAFLITNLTFKVSYTVQVGAHTTPGLGELSEMISVTTAEVVPPKPSSIDVLHTKNTELKLTWSAPFPFSGDIINYWISYRSIESVFEDTQQQFQSYLVQGNSDVYTFEDLSPGTMYEIQINASTAKGFGEAATILASTTFTVDIGKTLPVTDKMKKDIQLFGTSTEVLVPSLSEDSGISKDTTLIDYIIVLEYGKSSISSKRRRKRYIDTSILGEYNETGPPFYITALLPLNGLPKKFIIGDGGVYGGYTNVPLTIGRQYSVYYGLISLIQGEPFYYVHETPSIHFTAGSTETVCHCSSTAAIIVSVIAVVLILCLVIVVVFLFRRQSSAKGSNEEKGNFGIGIKKIEESEMCRLPPKVTKDMKQDYEDPDHGHQYACVDVSTQRSTQVTSAARPRRSESNDEENVYTGLVKELALNESSCKPKDQQCKTGRLPKNVKKNRYPDILPIDDHCPKLVPIKPDGSSGLTDYINASFVDTCTKKKTFLITQMPLPHTLVDFWRMVYDHKSRLIVMLNDHINTDGDNCQYWPNEYEIKHCGQYELELVCVKRVGDVVERSFTLSKGNESILIYQWQVLRWIESHNSGSLAQNIAGLMNMITEIKQQTGDGPLTVHCINGIGRSGVFCAAVSACERLKIDQMVDVSEAVKTLRNNRPNMVQTMEEYKLCYEVIMQWSDATLQAYENVKA